MRQKPAAADSSIRKLILGAGIFAVVAVAALAVLIAPRPLPTTEIAAGYQLDPANGALMFAAANCSACHMTPDQPDRNILGGGLELKSAFGTFTSPNISPDAEFGIGSWSELEFVNAVKRGVGRNGEHLYPAFPYQSYSLMKTDDVRDIYAYIKSLPSVHQGTKSHHLEFPYNLRLAIGAWKLLYFRPQEFSVNPGMSALQNRGAYLVEAAAHCAECHTARDGLGGHTGDRYVGAPSMEPDGLFAPNITPHVDGLGDWSEEDIADFLMTGENRCFNAPEGMRNVLASTTNLPAEEIAAIAAYLHALPAKPGNGEHKKC